MKTPISYYGGKQKMLKYILPMIPAHTCYVEPFIGGGAVFFAKPKSDVEVINDNDGNLVNFYWTAQKDFDALQKEINCYCHSRELYHRGLKIIHTPAKYTNIERAAAYWYVINTSVNNKIGGGLVATSNSHRGASVFFNKQLLFTAAICKRLRYVTIENRDALRVIDIYDGEDTFFYIDPPYYSANMGHYNNKFARQDFSALLDKLETIRGKFLLSSYPCDGLDRWGWKTRAVDMPISANQTGNKKQKRKIECLTYNYTLHGAQIDLFERINKNV